MSKNTENDTFEVMLQDVKSLVKGKDPDNLQQKCLELCQKFLSSYWLRLGLNDIEVERLTGGMTNQIYRCKALTTNGVEDNETPEEVVIRFYGEKYDCKNCPRDSRFYDGLVAWIASDKGFGTKMYGLFEGGQVLKYYKHRLMEAKDLYDQVKLDTVAQILAKFHILSPPIEKNLRKNWFIGFATDLFVDDIYGKFLAENKSLLAKNDCKALLDFDLKTEVLWLKERIECFESPIVLTHNDFRMGNILMTDSNDIVLTDFDFACYGYRGYDLALFFMEFEKRSDNKIEFKDESIVRQFITSYVKQCERMYGKSYSSNPKNSVQHILQECKQFTLCTTMTWITFFMKFSKELPLTKDILMDTINKCIIKFLVIKKMLIDEHLV